MLMREDKQDLLTSMAAAARSYRIESPHYRKTWIFPVPDARMKARPHTAGSRFGLCTIAAAVQ